MVSELRPPPAHSAAQLAGVPIRGRTVHGQPDELIQLHTCRISGLLCIAQIQIMKSYFYVDHTNPRWLV